MADPMYRCEWRRRFIVNGRNEWRWVEREVGWLGTGKDQKAPQTTFEHRLSQLPVE